MDKPICNCCRHEEFRVHINTRQGPHDDSQAKLQESLFKKAFSPQQKLNWLILNEQAKLYPSLLAPTYPITNLNRVWYDFANVGHLDKAIENVRTSGTPTGLPCRVHFGDGREVAARLPDGSWVGWTHHFHPEDNFPWIENAYDVKCVEKEIIMFKREFSVVEANNG